MLSKKAMMAAPSAVPQYIEDVFSTYLYTGNAWNTFITQDINNGIDLIGEGGLVWIKGRSIATYHSLNDTNRGTSNSLSSNTTDASNTYYEDSVQQYFSNGFRVQGSEGSVNQNGQTYCSWTFRKAPKFFDVVTYTGNGTTQNISHNLGSVPGMMIVKRTNTTGTWAVYHRSLATNERLILETTASKDTSSTTWNNTAPTSTVFSVGTNVATNNNGDSYVAYLFAHDAGGFGESGDQNVVSCGSFTISGSNVTTSLGYEPQYLLVKRTTSAKDWEVVDIMRGFTVDGSTVLYPNLDGGDGGDSKILLTSTGFTTTAALGNGDYIYLAIRRPNKPPTSGTQVFYAGTGNGSTTVPAYITNFPVDAGITSLTRTGTTAKGFTARILGNQMAYTDSIGEYNTENDAAYDSSIGFMKGSWGGANGYTQAFSWAFRRAPGFFDVVCYTGTGVARTVAHNLTVAPELMIVKPRSANGAWSVYSSFLGNTSVVSINTDSAVSTGTTRWDSTSPTSTVFSLGTLAGVNGSGVTFVAYLFATLSGISKVGNYTGTGTTLQINCGFTTGARFVLIKATSTTGNWFVWDTARGIISGNDPYLALNTTSAEVTNTDWVDPLASGFELSNAGGNLVNTNGVSYIFLAVA